MIVQGSACIHKYSTSPIQLCTNPSCKCNTDDVSVYIWSKWLLHKTTAPHDACVCTSYISIRVPQDLHKSPHPHLSIALSLHACHAYQPYMFSRVYTYMVYECLDGWMDG